MMSSTKRKSYTADFKMKVISNAETVGNREAARLFSVDEKSVREWRKGKDKIAKMDRRKRSMRYRKPFWPELEENLCRWVKVQREAGYPVSTIKIRIKAKAMASEMGIADFQGGSNWCYRFMRRNNLRIRMRTTVGQKLPDNWQQKREDFLNYFKDLVKSENYSYNQIINMDEVPLTFDCPPNRTVDMKCTSTVSIVTTGHEKTNMTVVLACCADGSKLKPMIIFKRKTMPKVEFPHGVFISVNEKGWMNKETMITWMNEIWRKRKGSFFNSKGLLILDSMKAHTDDGVKAAFASPTVGANLAVIPGGLTKLLQPLDISVNRSFKAKVRAQWEDWMSSGFKEYTKSGNLKKASLVKVAEWVKNAWDSITVKTVKSGFKKAGLLAYEEDESEDSENELDEEVSENGEELSQTILQIFNSETEDSDFDGF